jgi:glycosyltransferase involved in cell wall biosynthesis
MNAALEEAGEDWEIILVNDGSPGPAGDGIRELASSLPRVRGIDLVRNFGQHNALLALGRIDWGRKAVFGRPSRPRSSCDPSREGIQARHPGYDDIQLDRALFRQIYGEALFRKVFPGVDERP